MNATNSHVSCKKTVAILFHAMQHALVYSGVGLALALCMVKMSALSGGVRVANCARRSS